MKAFLLLLVCLLGSPLGPRAAAVMGSGMARR